MSEQNVLIVGGTGMLKGTVEYFLVNRSNTYVVGRNQQKFAYLKQSYKKFPGNFIPLSLNYNEQKFIDTVRQIKENRGHLDVCIC
ncbi:hypothetical protein [Thalassobacillus sp. C254]|uniref:hypothetical protein n=1 Tax=Thalassobacillus sp. C254 TaxID=1225341 RepID=UPI0006D05C59|nr:hypothetical protein [Thalassobacillus sp. C254]